MYYVYVIRSEVWGRCYYGFTGDIFSRLQEHNRGKVRSTKNGISWKLLNYKELTSKRLALEYEKKLKKSAFERNKMLRSRGRAVAAC